MYLYELVNWLTTVVDSLVIKEIYKDEAYKGALGYIAECLMVRCLRVFGAEIDGCVVQDFLTGRDIPMMNQNAITNILVDVDFLEDELKRIGRAHLASVFVELRSVGHLPYQYQSLIEFPPSDNFDPLVRQCPRVPRSGGSTRIIWCGKAPAAASAFGEVGEVWCHTTRSCGSGVGRKEAERSGRC